MDAFPLSFLLLLSLLMVCGPNGRGKEKKKRYPCPAAEYAHAFELGRPWARKGKEILNINI